MNKKIIFNARIITMNWQMDVFPQGSLLIEDGTIVKVSATVLEDQEAERYDAQGMILMPGFINTHTHVPMTLFRGFADDFSLHKWLTEYIFPAEARFITPDNVRLGSQLAFLEMIKSGITCFNDMYYFEDVIAHEAKKAGLRAVLSDALIDFPTPSFKSVDEGLLRNEEIVATWKDDPIIHPSICAHSPYTCSKATLQRAKTFADKHNLLLHVHVAETQKEIDDMRQQTGLTPAQYLHSIGLLDQNVCAAHCVWLNDDDVKLFADSGTSIAHCPKSNLKLSSGIAPVYSYIQKGVNVGVGTDGAASNNNLDMVEEMRFSALLQKVVDYNPEAMNARESLKMATINGAKALHLDTLTGSIEAGKKADLIIVNSDAVNMMPAYDDYSSIVYAMNSKDVRSSMVNGEWLMKDRVVLHIDEEAVMAEMREKAATIAATKN